MTYVKDVFGNDMFKDFGKFYVGFDDHVNKLTQLANDVAKNVPNYPPYNIKKVSDGQYVVELAVAGFGKTEIDIEMEGGKLTIKGSTSEDDGEYLFKGIANRAFTRTFTLMDNVEVKNAELVNGMLKVFLEAQHQMVKKIKVDVR